MTRMQDRSRPDRIIHVTQGEHATSGEPGVVMSTILGSCVATCMFDPDARIGGMNHFLLPTERHGASSELLYGLNLMELLINSLLRQGARKNRLRAKIFGGANVFLESSTIGRRNGEFARSFLRDEGIACIAESLGGESARRIHFRPTTGSVSQNLVNPKSAPAVVRQAATRPVRRPDAGEPELWD